MPTNTAREFSKSALAIRWGRRADILTRDLAIFEKTVSDAVKVPINQNEFDALVSIAFNTGG